MSPRTAPGGHENQKCWPGFRVAHVSLHSASLTAHAFERVLLALCRLFVSSAARILLRITVPWLLGMTGSSPPLVYRLPLACYGEGHSSRSMEFSCLLFVDSLRSHRVMWIATVQCLLRLPC